MPRPVPGTAQVSRGIPRLFRVSLVHPTEAPRGSQRLEAVCLSSEPVVFNPFFQQVCLFADELSPSPAVPSPCRWQVRVGHLGHRLLTSPG